MNKKILSAFLLLSPSVAFAHGYIVAYYFLGGLFIVPILLGAIIVKKFFSQNDTPTKFFLVFTFSVLLFFITCGLLTLVGHYQKSSEEQEIVQSMRNENPLKFAICDKNVADVKGFF